jgi:hypothetical protein
VIGLWILVARLSVPHALSNFQAAAHPGTLSRHGVVQHPAGMVDGKGCSSAEDTTTVTRDLRGRNLDATAQVDVNNATSH